MVRFERRPNVPLIDPALIRQHADDAAHRLARCGTVEKFFRTNSEGTVPPLLTSFLVITDASWSGDLL
jgi:hypothetical protein